MERKPRIRMKNLASVAAALLIALFCCTEAFATDTDIYAVSAKPNTYMLIDSSGSMAWGVYEHSIDYGAMYDYLITINDTIPPYNTYIKDPVSGDALYGNHKQRNKIFLLRGNPNLAIINAGGRDIAFTGDPGSPSIVWQTGSIVDTHTLIDENGDLSDDGTGGRRITVDGAGYILFDGQPLPLGLNLKLHDLTTLYSGSVVDNGFGGMLNAPGYYFSGYEGIDITLPYEFSNNIVGKNDVAENGDANLYFFVTGNWVNLQAVYNLDFTSNGQPAWQSEPYPVTPWAPLNYSLDYPDDGGANTTSYANNLTEATTLRTITHPGAAQMRLHFSFFDVQGNGNVSTFTKDYVKVYNKSGLAVAQYDNDNKPTASGGWTPQIAGDTATIKLKSDAATTGKGYTIDKIEIIYQDGSYKILSRLGVAKDALLYVLEQFKGKMNWGLARFDKDGNANGATMLRLVNPGDSDDQQYNDMVARIGAITALGGTPLMEALQDTWNNGFYGIRANLSDVPCRKNYIISMTDGFPSSDTDTGRISGVTFADWDNDNWVADPSQDSTPPEDYYDDVAHWIYTHSWMDKSIVNPADSYFNVITHHISFGARHPLLQDAAEESGGQFIAAYNKEQLVAAFHSLVLSMNAALSYTAPVVSVDAVNKIQSGDDLYMGLFLPKASAYWVGNLKKFKMGDGSADRPNTHIIYDAANEPALDVHNSDPTKRGNFLDDTAAFWGDDTDTNDHDHQVAADILEDGAGEVLLKAVHGYFAAGTYWNRPIYTYKGGVGGSLVKFDQGHITAADLGVADTTIRNKLVNFTHGYTYDADGGTGAPLAVRDWVLGPIIHSRPVVVDYYDTAQQNLPLLKRFVVVGSNDGMLHVFDDTTGAEVFSFVPQDMLLQLKNVQANFKWDTVDGSITLYRNAKNPKYLIFGERRGGSNYWCLDVSSQNPLQWTVAFTYSHPELTGWSEMKLATIQVGLNAVTGEKTYKDVAIFTGGYDVEEDNFPEPFNDLNTNGHPYKADGTIDPAEWNLNDGAQDVYNNNLYDEYNPGMNETGRGIFVLDIDPSGVPGTLLFSAVYGATDVSTGTAQKYSAMKFCFPAGPSVVVGTDRYTYDHNGQPTIGIKNNVLLGIYALDIYANLFKVRFDFAVTDPLQRWQVNKVFFANPGSSSGSGRFHQGDDFSDQGRKAFNPPAISWGGSGSYFDGGNYVYPGVTFSGRDAIASLFFGTGDREHPKYTMIRNRFYAIYDDSSITAKEGTNTVPISFAPYKEDDLLNLTCDELGAQSYIRSCYLGALKGMGDLTGICDPAATTNQINADMKKFLRTKLTDTPTYPAGPSYVLEERRYVSTLSAGTPYEDDVKGWYIILEDQGNSVVCSHVQYRANTDVNDATVATISNATVGDRDNHRGEHILSSPALYAGNLYFTTYQPAAVSVCDPQRGNGFTYALDYREGTAALDLNPANPTTKNITDRYGKYYGIYGVPSSFTIITRDGQAEAMASMGGGIAGGGTPTEDDPLGLKIKSPGSGLELYYWRLGNSLQP